MLSGEKMRVVVDVSVVGLAQLYETARTGIYRVISSLIPELIKIKDCDISFTSFSSTEINLLVDDFFIAAGHDDRFLATSDIEKKLFKLATGFSDIDKKKIMQRLVAKLFRKRNISKIIGQADVFHSTFSPLPDSGSLPLSFLTIYDMIPVLHPEYFWDDFDVEFERILSSVKVGHDRVLTISQSSKDDICGYLNIDPAMVYVAYPAADSGLYHPETDKEKKAQILRKYNIPVPEYFLSLATLEYRKNLRASIDAFRRVLNEPGMGEQYLVLVGTRGWKIEELLDEIAADALLRERIIFTGYVADEDLSGLYSSAAAFIYPSLYEGFGLPPLEAMQCGVPVITSNISSLPEVVGKAGIMVPPADVDALAQAMLDVRNDSDLWKMMVKRGLQQSECFSWARCARETVAAYRHGFRATA
jgi:glycosyltransferase involved in cell wall biosynthesis